MATAKTAAVKKEAPAEKPVKAAKEKAFVPPKSLAVCADMIYELQHERYALQKQVDALAAKEKILAEHLINNLPKSDASGISGKLANVSIQPKEVVQVEDWDALYGFILTKAKKDPGVWSLMQRRVGEASVKEMWANGATVPGCTKIIVPRVSIRKL